MLDITERTNDTQWSLILLRGEVIMSGRKVSFEHNQN